MNYNKSFSTVNKSFSIMNKSINKIMHNSMHNKYVLYLLFVISLIWAIGYIQHGKYKPVFFFILLGMLIYQLNKNMSVVLTLSLAISILCIYCGVIKCSKSSLFEGMESMESATDAAKKEQLMDKLKDVNEELHDAVGIMKDNKNNTNSKDIKEKIKTKVNSKVNNKANSTKGDDNNDDIDVEGFSDYKEGSKKKTGGSTGGSRLDYAATIGSAYENLDKMLGSDGVKKLTTDTKKLMNQQKELFSTIENMAPMLAEAKKMLGGFDMTKINSIASSITGK